MNDKVKQTLQAILDQFKTGDIPKAVAISMFPIPDIPCSKWSLLNRTLVFLSGTVDARGYRQWQQTNRFVKKGSKAIYILVLIVGVLNKILIHFPHHFFFTLRANGMRDVQAFVI